MACPPVGPRSTSQRPLGPGWVPPSSLDGSQCCPVVIQCPSFAGPRRELSGGGSSPRPSPCSTLDFCPVRGRPAGASLCPGGLASGWGRRASQGLWGGPPGQGGCSPRCMQAMRAGGSPPGCRSRDRGRAGTGGDPSPSRVNCHSALHHGSLQSALEVEGNIGREIYKTSLKLTRQGL